MCSTSGCVGEKKSSESTIAMPYQPTARPQKFGDWPVCWLAHGRDLVSSHAW